MFTKRVRILGRSVPLAIILLLATVGLAAAGIFASMKLGLEGNIREVVGPDMTLAVTNDDGLVDYAAFDSNDDGSDPSDVTVPGGAPRFGYDLQSCTANINGSGNVDVTMMDTYSDAFCSVRVSVTNNTADILYLIEAVFTGTAPLETALNSGSACGYVLNPGEDGNVIIDIWPTEGASGSWAKAENEVDVRWGLSGTFSCP